MLYVDVDLLGLMANKITSKEDRPKFYPSGYSVWLPMPKYWVRSQHPSTQWNLRGGSWGSVEIKYIKKQTKISLFKILCILKVSRKEIDWFEFWLSCINGSLWLGRQQVWSIVWLFGPLTSYAFFLRVGSWVQMNLTSFEKEESRPCNGCSIKF